MRQHLLAKPARLAQVAQIGPFGEQIDVEILGAEHGAHQSALARLPSPKEKGARLRWQAHTAATLPIPVRRALGKLGEDIRNARRRRRIPVAVMAERASVSRTTLTKVERGEPGVAVGTYATVLFTLGLVDRIAGLADPTADRVGRELEEEHLPQRIRHPRKSRAAPPGRKGGR